MDNIDIKALKKLADACRKAGIKTFKGHGIEFTLDDSYTTPQRRNTKGSTTDTSAPGNPVNEGGMTDDDLLFWSVGGDVDVPGPTPETE